MKTFNVFIAILISFIFVNIFAQEKATEQTLKINKILRLDIKSSINPATLNYLESGFQHANQNNHHAILIVMNTPGGLVSTTKKILNVIGESNLPTIVWIAPEGSSATSAGAIISAGAHLIFMSEGTNIGAATPVSLGNDILGKKNMGKEENKKNDESKNDTGSDLRQKAINDLVALVTSLAKSRNKNVELFSQMIEKASSFDAQTALEKNLINGIANDQDELIKSMSNKLVHIKGKDFLLDVSTNTTIQSFSMDLGQKLLDVFANPSLAYILFLIGAALIYFELQAPGGFISGAIGVIFILMAGIGFQVLPLNLGALGLIILSFVLFILEIYVTSYGILAISGLASLIFGSLFLFRTNDSYLELSNSLIFSSVSAIAVFLGLVAYMFLKGSKNIGKQQFNALVGKDAVITNEKNEVTNLYQVKVGGEFWKAKTISTNDLLRLGDHVKIIEQDQNDLSLIIEKI